MISKDSNPAVNAPRLWVDEARNRIVSWSGDGPTHDGARNRSLWDLAPDGSGGGSWTRGKQSGGIFRNAGGLSTTCGGRGYLVGGWFGEKTDDRATRGAGYTSTPGLVTYDLATGEWANETVPKEFYPNRRDGQAQCLPFGGPQGSGLPLFLGGADFTPTQPYEQNLLSLDRVTIYDPARKAWYEQRTTGGPPERRRLFCSAGQVSSGKNLSTYEMLVCPYEPYPSFANRRLTLK